ncbi:MAG: pyridoxamine 5'-phosphate oxidase family protein [Acidimicrobiia bacterium]|nr:pyridoxamine 5'-phosphate oxidase family protein [Acidimicrobiia bacterium]
MRSWKDFTAAAPETAAIFDRRLGKTGMALMATIRSDGFPRISPLEPAVLADRLYLGMMPDSTKSLDLRRDARCCLHSATEDKMVGDGDAKLWGRGVEVVAEAERREYAAALEALNGVDVEAMGGYDLWILDVTAAAGLVGEGDHLRISAWRDGEPERIIEKR